MIELSTWRRKFAKIVRSLREDINTFECTLSDDELDEIFNDAEWCDIGGPNLITAWTTNYVYFRIKKDGNNFVGYAPRHPYFVLPSKSQLAISKEN